MDGTRYVLVNAGDAVRAHEYNASTASKATAKIRFEGECVTALAWRGRGEEEEDVVVICSLDWRAGRCARWMWGNTCRRRRDGRR